MVPSSLADKASLVVDFDADERVLDIAKLKIQKTRVEVEVMKARAEFEATQEFLSVVYSHSSERQLSWFAFLVPK